MSYNNVLRKKISNRDQPPAKQILAISKELRSKMIKQYSTSQGYFYSKIIQNAIEKKQNDKNCIKINDIKYNDCKQHMEKYYFIEDTNQEFPELIQYYKYYSQDSICFLNTQFLFLAVYHEKKKAVLYEQLKKQLNISDSEDTLGSVSRLKSPKKFQNVLTDLSKTIHNDNDQSYLVGQVLKKLVSFYGPSRLKTINKIDSQFNFIKTNNQPQKYKNIVKQNISSMGQSKLLLQSKNQPKKNNFMVIGEKNIRNQTHRRFGSCQVPKSAVIRTNNNQNCKQTQKDFKQFRQNKQIIKQTKNRIRRRRKSAQNIHSIEPNSLTNSETYKFFTVKTQQQNRLSSIQGNKILIMENNFRSKMESIRNKIKQDKQNIIKKQQTNCFIKKKTKKI